MAEKLLSIIIPTKDRDYYCKRVLEYMLSIDDERIEYVIQNNGKSDELDSYIKKKNDNRIVYRHVYEPLCQVENSDQAIALSSGKYLCFIGDDDIVLPNIMQYVEYAIRNNVDNIAQKTPISYEWPSQRRPTGRLIITLNSYSCEKIDYPSKCVTTYIRYGCCENPKDYKLPILYHGITKRKCIESVKKETGHYVGGSSPDSYTSVALAKYVINQIVINDFFSIAGACPQSATSLNLIGGHCGTLDDAPHLKNRGNYYWDNLIPQYYSVQTIWAESSITALRETKNILADKLNLKELFCKAYIGNRSIRKLIVKQTNISLQQNNINRIVFWTECIPLLVYIYMLQIFKRVYARILREMKVNKVIVISDVQDIRDCVKYIQANR